MKNVAVIVIALLVFYCCNSPIQNEIILEKPDKRVAEPYIELYSQENRKSDPETWVLGKGYLDNNNLTTNSALNILEIRTTAGFGNSVSFSPIKITSIAELLNSINAKSDQYYKSVILGPKTTSYINSIQFLINSVTYIRGCFGRGNLKYINNCNITEEAMNIYNTNEEEFRSTYGLMYNFAIEPGYCIFLLETYIIDPKCKEDYAQIEDNIARLMNVSSEDKQELEKKISIAGVTKKIYFFSSFSDEPDKPIKNYKDMYEYIYEHCENQVLKDSEYSVSVYGLRNYYLP